MGEHKQTIIDIYKEMGFSADLLLLLFMVLFVFGCVIQRRKLEQSWRKGFLITAFLPMTAGVCLFGYRSVEFVYQCGQGATGLGSPGQVLWWPAECLQIIGFSAWLTIILLVFSALLFIGKKEERGEPDGKSGGSDIPV